ncbi:Wzz/FepE/Etk N-terminal domain-containing protein [Candidatus Bipolaricaulota bacterium]
MDDREIELIDYIRVFWRQKWIILATLVVAMGSAWLLSEVPESTYRASASLLLMPPLATEIDADNLSSSLPATVYKELATSTTVLKRILEGADLTSPLTLEQLRSSLSISVESFKAESEGLQPEPLLLHFSVKGSYPEELLAIGSAWIHSFSELYGSVFQDRTSRSHAYISENYQQVEGELALVSEERIRFLADHPVEVLTVERSSLRNRLLSAHTALDEAESELATAIAYFEAGGTMPVSRGSDYMLSESIDPYTLRGALLAGLSVEQFEDLLSARIQTLQAETDVLSDKLLNKQHVLDEAISGLNELDVRINILGESAAFLSSRLQAAKLALAETPDPIHIINEPLVSQPAISPRKLTNIAVAGFLSLMIGTLLAFFVDYLQRVREREQASQVEIPDSSDVAKNTLDARARRDNRQDRSKSD